MQAKKVHEEAQIWWHRHIYCMYMKLGTYQREICQCECEIIVPRYSNNHQVRHKYEPCCVCYACCVACQSQWYRICWQARSRRDTHCYLKSYKIC